MWHTVTHCHSLFGYTRHHLFEEAEVAIRSAQWYFKALEHHLGLLTYEKDQRKWAVAHLSISYLCVVLFGSAQHNALGVCLWQAPENQYILAQKTWYLEIQAYGSERNLDVLNLIGRFFEKTRIPGWYWFSTLISLVTLSPFGHKRSHDVAKCGRALSYWRRQTSSGLEVNGPWCRVSVKAVLTDLEVAV